MEPKPMKLRKAKRRKQLADSRTKLKRLSKEFERENKEIMRVLSKMYKILENEKNWIPLEKLDELMYKDAKPALRRLKAGKAKLHRLEDI